MTGGADIDLGRALGVALDPDLCEMALTHRSYAFEAGGLSTNERLEFLGDAVLGLVVTDLVYHQFPEEAEGRLAKIRAAAVNTTSLAAMARDLGVGAAVRLGRGEEATGGRDKDSILADTLEALFGAVYLDRGMDVAADVVRGIFAPLIAGLAMRRESLDWKTSLQELVAAELGGVPRYNITESGPDHQKHFVAAAVIADEEIGHGEGRSKKEAEQGAAEQAYAILRARLARAAGDPMGVGSDASARETGAIGSGAHATGAMPPAETGDGR